MRAPLALPLLLFGCTTIVESEGTDYEGDVAGECADGADNDHDGAWDCDDPDCERAPECAGDDDDAADDDDAVDDDDAGDDDDAPEGLLYAHTADRLYRVDPEPPYDVELVGRFTGGNPLGAALTGISDLAIDLEGRMYALGFWELYRVDPRTAALTYVTDVGAALEEFNSLTAMTDGTLAAGRGNRIVAVDGDDFTVATAGTLGPWSFAGDMVGLADGLMYCLVNDDGQPSSPTSLVVWDPLTGDTREVGATGEGAMYGVGWALDTLFGFTGTGRILTIDAGTGQATAVAETGVPFWGAATNPVRWRKPAPD